jgi:cell fate (sporulation/competence/biofilm development) regulator YmcA (YheA/YmcA/DUF963 family)
MDQLVDEIKSTELYKQFNQALTKVENHQEINDLISRIKHLQKQRVNANFLEKEEFKSKLTNEIDELHLKLDSIPLYASYMELKDELESLVQKISVSIETSINK